MMKFLQSVFPAVAFIIGWILSFHFYSTPDVNIPIEENKNNKEVTENVASSSLEEEKEPTSPFPFSSQTFTKVYKIIKSHYIDPEDIKKEQVEEWIVRGLVYSLKDPHSEFYNEEQSEDFEQEMKGDFEGIGARLDKNRGVLQIEDVLKNTPAARSGILPKDIIINVDDQSIEDETVWETILRIRGEKGTEVKITVYREGEEELLDFFIVRDTIHIDSVTMDMVGTNKDIVFLEVSQFGDDTTELFDQYLKKALLQNPKGIIVDLRYNTGGYLEGAVDLLSWFFPRGTTVVSIKERDKGTEDLKTYRFQYTSLPLVVVINGGSASASEIFSGAIQDLSRGKVVGTESYGKGSVQQLFPLSANKQLKLTIAKWFTPSGKSPSFDEPIIPDVIIERPKEEFESEGDKDSQKQKAVEVIEKIIQQR